MNKRAQAGIVLGVGLAASIAANTYHGQHNAPGLIIGAWAPLALFGSLHLLTHVLVPRGRLAVALWSAAAIVALIAFYVSYRHQVALALRFGEEPLSAHLLPITVDLPIAIAAGCLIVLSKPGRAGMDIQSATVEPERVTEHAPSATLTLAPEPERARTFEEMVAEVRDLLAVQKVTNRDVVGRYHVGSKRAGDVLREARKPHAVDERLAR